MNYYERQLQQTCSEWIAGEMARCTELAFVTCTLKQGIKLPWGVWEPLTEEAADKAMVAFLKMLDQRTYGTSGKRFSRFLRSFDVMEGGRSRPQRTHRHLLLEVPSDRMNFDCFAEIIETTWQKIRWGHREIDIQRCLSTGAVTRYMLKKGLNPLRLGTTRF